jgi:hypothetical protein
VITADLAASYGAQGYNPVRHAIRHCVFGKRPFTYLLIIDDISVAQREQAALEQLFHTPPVAESQTLDGELHARIEFAGASHSLAIRALDGGVELLQDSFTQHDPLLFGEHPIWRLRRIGRELAMPVLLLPYQGRPPLVKTTFDACAGQVTLMWEAGGEWGVDALEFTPGVLAVATLTRNGTPLAGAKCLLGSKHGAAASG